MKCSNLFKEFHEKDFFFRENSHEQIIFNIVIFFSREIVIFLRPSSYLYQGVKRGRPTKNPPCNGCLKNVKQVPVINTMLNTFIDVTGEIQCPHKTLGIWKNWIFSKFRAKSRTSYQRLLA